MRWDTHNMFAFFKKPFFSDYRTLLGLWLFMPVIVAITKWAKHNNFEIFKHVFWHVYHQLPLYVPYPEEYGDVNLYGPFFSIIVAPFAVLPDFVGHLLWLIVLSMTLYVVIQHLDLTHGQKIFIYWFSAHELLTALQMSQFNIAIATIILASFICVEKEEDILATLFIIIGTLVKLYGIVGLAFFFFSKHKIRFVSSFILWGIALFVLPMLISFPAYIVEQYKEWFFCLLEKNQGNLSLDGGTNISLLGLVRRISRCTTYNDIWLILGGLILFALPYLRLGQYKNKDFRYNYLASTMLFVLLFSTGSESSGYITAVIGVCIWYCSCGWKRSVWDIALLVFVFFFTIMAPSDLYPQTFRKFIQMYSLKALPCVIVWFKLSYELLTRDYTEEKYILEG